MSENFDEHTEQEDLLQWCLDPSSRPVDFESRLARDAGLRASLEDLEKTLSGLRDGFRREEQESQPEASSLLVDEILSRTTREDLSWRGDLRLVRNHFQSRMRTSWVMKLVAASLIIHLSALPILAFMVLTDGGERHFNIFIEKPEEPPFEEVLPEPDRDVESVQPPIGSEVRETEGSK